LQRDKPYAGYWIDERDVMDKIDADLIDTDGEYHTERLESLSLRYDKDFTLALKNTLLPPSLILQPYFRQREKEKPVAAASVFQNLLETNILKLF
jgi:hypothetical protein